MLLFSYMLLHQHSRGKQTPLITLSPPADSIPLSHMVFFIGDSFAHVWLFSLDSSMSILLRMRG